MTQLLHEPVRYSHLLWFLIWAAGIYCIITWLSEGGL